MPHPTLPNAHPGARRHGRAQRGASMIELLVSVLIFAFGMLGLIGLLTKTIGFSQVSLYRSQAVALSDDVLDRMRADPARARSGDWTNTVDDEAASFNGSSITQTELKEWKGQVEALLPDGKASIDVDAGKVTVTIQWNERGTPSALPPVISYL